MLTVRPFVKNVIGVDGGWKDGPWAWRFAYLATTLPTYSLLLLTYGTAFNRRPYFGSVIMRMWGRVLPRKAAARLERYVLGV